MLWRWKNVGLMVIIALMIVGISVMVIASSKLTLRVWYPDEAGIKPKYIAQAAEAFEKDFPNVNLEIKRFRMPPGDFKTKLLLALASNEGPDVILFSGYSNIGEFAEADYIIPLDKYVNKWADWSQYPKNVKDGVTYEGHVYAIPYGLDMRWLYYNKNIFRSVGLPVPWQPQNWNDIINAAIVIKEREPSVIPYVLYAGVAGSGGTMDQGFLPLFYGAGGKFYDSKTHKWIVDSPAYREALEYYREVFLTYKLVPQEVMTLPKPWTTMRRKIAEGGLGILYEGGWVYGGFVQKLGLKKTQETIGYAMMPSKNGKPFFTIGGSGTVWYINSQSKHPDLAWEFIKRFNTKEIVAKINLEEAHPVARMDSANLPEFKSQKYLVDSTEALKYAKYEPMRPDFSRIIYRVQLLTGAVASGRKTIEEAMKDYINEVKGDVGANNVEILK